MTMAEATSLRLSVDEVIEGLQAGISGCCEVAGIGPLWIEGAPRRGRLLLAHGAGAGQDSAFMAGLRQALAAAGIQALGIEFDYMQRMRAEGRRRPPPRVEKLVEELRPWCDIVSRLAGPPCWLGGKSMGGRVASLLAAREAVPGLVLCGYPFHPPGKPESTRLAHWPDITCPALVLQGERDPFGTRAEAEDYDLPANAKVHFLCDGDHDWKPRKASGLTQAQLIDEAARAIASTLESHSRGDVSGPGFVDGCCR
ncbi:alpha/beta family hydrolase [Halomonas sp. H5]|uniref:alpha/beta family hydrolase n=1 Tax=Halomonas sp. H5 TaxID=3423910 RepID=UPI003D35DCF4